MASELHPDARALLDTMEEQDVPAWHTLSPTRAREIHRELNLPGPEYEPEAVASVSDTVVRGAGHGIGVRVYEPADPGPGATIVWSHGGGFVLGDVDTEDPTARALANATGCVVLSVDYRLAPEHPFPAALEDVVAVTEWASEHADSVGGDPDRLVVGGGSAGANLAAAATLVARDRGGPGIDYQVLAYPSVNARRSFDSADEYDGYFLTAEDGEWFNEQYLGSDFHARNPYAFPIEAADLSGLPDATVVTAGFDPLQGEGKAYANRLGEAGVDVSHHHFGGMIHAFMGMLAPEPWERALEAHERVGRDVRSYFG